MNRAADLFTIVVSSLLVFFRVTYKQTFSSSCSWINTLHVCDEDSPVTVKCMAEMRLIELDNIAR